jgi:sensor histidine kinase YesM
VLHVGGWLGYAISQYLGTLLYDIKTEHMQGYVTVIAVATVSGFLLSLELRYVYRRLWLRSPQVLVVGALLCCYVFALVWRVIINSTYMRYASGSMEWVMASPLEFFANAMAGTYLLLCWTAIYFGIKYYRQLQDQREATLRAATLAQEAQLKMLRYQLNPHFLFNTLNAISTLILDGQSKIANLAVTRLSDFLRYTLDKDPMKRVSLRQEVDALNLYLGIEKLRFGDRLKLSFDIEDAAYQGLVPSLILQPLIENALKYAVAPREEGGHLRIEGCVRGKTLGLAVQDDGPGLAPNVETSNGRGVGLRNTRERLAVLYGDRDCMTMRNAQPGLRIEITLPYERAAQL